MVGVRNLWHKAWRRLVSLPSVSKISNAITGVFLLTVGCRACASVSAQLTRLPSEPEERLKSQIAVITAYTAEIASYARPTAEAKRIYCEKKGYRFRCYGERSDFVADRDPTWSKIPFILREFQDESLKWVFWSDADAAVVNADVWIENLIDTGFDLIISRDQHGINAGNFLIKNTSWSRELLEQAWTRQDLARRLFHEQQALAELIEADWQGAKSRVKFVSQRLFNSYHYPDYLDVMKPLKGDGSFQRSDFILHVPGQPESQRIERLSEFWAASAEPH